MDQVPDLNKEKDGIVPQNKKEARETEAFRIAMVSKEMASAFWRKNHPVK
jgi:hypothetical protein